MEKDMGVTPSGSGLPPASRAEPMVSGKAGIPNADELLPCLACGGECRIETFGGGVHCDPVDLWVCSQHPMFGGKCGSDLSCFGADAWNDAMRVVRKVGREQALEEIGKIIAHDLRWVRESRQREGLPTTPDTHVIPRHWPSYGQLCNWLDVIASAQAIEARRAIDSEAGVVGDESAVA